MGESPAKLRQKYRSYGVLKFRCFLATRDPNGLNKHTKKFVFIKNVLFGLEITQINKFDQFSNFFAYSRFSLNPLESREFSKF